MFGNFVPKSVQKCGRTSHVKKRAARKHIPHTFQDGFRTHTCDRTSHVCLRARTFATHTLLFSLPSINFQHVNNEMNFFFSWSYGKNVSNDRIFLRDFLHEALIHFPFLTLVLNLSILVFPYFFLLKPPSIFVF